MVDNSCILDDHRLLASLHGKRVLVTRPRLQAEELIHRLDAFGAVPIMFPSITIAPPADNYHALDAALVNLSTFDWAVFTSVNGVTHVWKRLSSLKLSARLMANVRLAAIGPATADALAGRGMEVEIIPDRFVAEALLEAIPNPRGQRFLLPRAADARDILRTGLIDVGADVSEVHAYRATRVTPSSQALAQLDAGVDYLTFTSSSTVRNFCSQVGAERMQRLAEKACVVVIGPVTAVTARAEGFHVDAVADEYTIAGLVDALRQLAS